MRLRSLQLVLILALTVSTGGPGSSILSATDQPAAPPVPEFREGQRLKLKAEVDGGNGLFQYRWFKDNVPIPGAVHPELAFDSLVLADAGTYWVTVSNEGGAVTSPPQGITIHSGKPSRVANISVVAAALNGVAVAFTMGGSGTSGSTEVLVRAAGPALTQFGVAGAMQDPVLRVSQQGQLVLANDDWDGSGSVSTAASAVGAFPFSNGSKDSALLVSLSSSSYLADAVDAGSGGGIIMIELYDTSSFLNRATPRLVNVSTRGSTGGPDAPLTAGFTVQGEAAITLLLRGIGPSLERFGVLSPIADPRLVLFRGQTQISSNENWSDVAPAEIEAAQAAVGAFALDANSLDAAVLVSLRPGTYTLIVSNPAAAGTALLEMYELP